MGELTVEATPFAGLQLVRGVSRSDARGRFSRLFCEAELAAIRPGLHFTQINLSETSRRHTLRGMHYQTLPAAEAKLIRCLRGRIFDVAIDLRAGSPTFLRWHGVELAEDENLAIFIPEGFAHGFQSLTDDAHLLYMHTAAWSPEHEAGIRHDDPRLGIDWPAPPGLVSERDLSYAPIDAGFQGIGP